MRDPETFLTELYVLVDEFGNAGLPPERHPGPAPQLCRSEVITLALFGQWARFPSERDFWRYVTTSLRPLFPRLPDRTQFNRAVRRQLAAITAFAQWLGDQLGVATATYEALDATAVPVRNVKRRGRSWLVGRAGGPGPWGTRRLVLWVLSAAGRHPDRGHHGVGVRPSVGQ